MKGGTLPASPRYRVTSSRRHEHEFGADLSAFAQVNLNVQSEQQFAVEQDPLLVQDAYTLVCSTRTMSPIFGVLRATTASPNDVYANFAKDSRRYFRVNVGAKFWSQPLGGQSAKVCAYAVPLT